MRAKRTWFSATFLIVLPVMISWRAVGQDWPELKASLVAAALTMPDTNRAILVRYSMETICDLDLVRNPDGPAGRTFSDYHAGLFWLTSGGYRIEERLLTSEGRPAENIIPKRTLKSFWEGEYRAVSIPEEVESLTKKPRYSANAEILLGQRPQPMVPFAFSRRETLTFLEAIREPIEVDTTGGASIRVTGTYSQPPFSGPSVLMVSREPVFVVTGVSVNGTNGIGFHIENLYATEETARTFRLTQVTVRMTTQKRLPYLTPLSSG